MYFSIIYAVEKNSRIFSRNNNLPWNIPEDLKYFRDITSKEYKKNCKNILIMGKNTYLSKPPLENSRRIEIVLSKNGKVNDNTFDTLENALDFCKTINYGKIFVIGGKKLIEDCLNSEFCEEIFQTELEFSKNINIENQNDTILNDLSNNLYNLYNLYSCILTRKTTNFCEYNQCSVDIYYKIYNRYKTSERNYLNLLQTVLDEGELRKDRTNIGTISLFGSQIEIDISETFPLLTTKKLNFKNIVTEVLWFLSGSTDISFLKQHGITIWDGNTSREFLDNRGLTEYKEGEIGPLYGYQWRNFGGDFRNPNSKGVDQIERMLNLLKTDPTSRRIFMSAWNPTDLDKMVLEPCHVSFQLYVSENKYLHGKLYMRSNDLFLGAPWNIAGYSLLIYMFAHLTNYKPGKLFYTVGDAHIYSNHILQIQEQLSRPIRKFPKLKITKMCEKFEDFDINSFELNDYDPHPFIKAEMAV
jgi:thymidylate synthase